MKRLAVLLAVVLVAACGADDKGDGKSISGDDVTVRMLDTSFEYDDITIPVGGSVTFVGTSNAIPHNAVATDGSWSTEEVFGSTEQYEGDEATLTFDTAGSYTFYCTFHGNSQGAGMAGTLTVEG